MIDLLQEKSRRGDTAVVILPVGPIDYCDFADRCNAEGIACHNLVTIFMDEHCDAAGNIVPESHPLSFRDYANRALFYRLDQDKRPPDESVIFPDPASLSSVQAAIDHHGGVDIAYAGIGINGHVAFNEPPESHENQSMDAVRNSDTRLLTLSRESRTQMVMGGTDGNWDLIPPRAVTIGLRQILSAERIHLTFLRSWHAGTLRRALFGPVTPAIPASFIQEHPNVTVTMTERASRLPLLNILQSIGE